MALLRKNDPGLWTKDGLASAVEEATDEKGLSVQWGWVCIGRIARRAVRDLTPMMFIETARDDASSELCAMVVVDPADVLDFLLADARANLSPGTRFEIRQEPPINFGRTHGMAWYSNAAMQKEGPFQPKEPAPMRGYLLVGRYLA